MHLKAAANKVFQPTADDSPWVGRHINRRRLDRPLRSAPIATLLFVIGKRHALRA
jgi:hypothetical protein